MAYICAMRECKGIIIPQVRGDKPKHLSGRTIYQLCHNYDLTSRTFKCKFKPNFPKFDIFSSEQHSYIPSHGNAGPAINSNAK